MPSCHIGDIIIISKTVASLVLWEALGCHVRIWFWLLRWFYLDFCRYIYFMYSRLEFGFGYYGDFTSTFVDRLISCTVNSRLGFGFGHYGGFTSTFVNMSARMRSK